MGLDMYLTKSTYVGAQYDWKEITGSIDLAIRGVVIPINLKRVSSIEESVGYWRKANAIHQWFVDNVQDGEDDCGRYAVEKIELKTLLDVCKRVLADHCLAELELPSQSGFFFGGTDYDEWYYDSLQNTIDMIEPILEEPEVDSIWVTYYYQSSW